MDRGELDSKSRIGSVKSSNGRHRERISRDNSIVKKPQMDFSERPSSRTRELHLARRDIRRFDQSKGVAESVKAQAESELVNAKKAVRYLNSRIEESNSKAKAQMRDLENLSRPERDEEEWALAIRKTENYQYDEVMRELEYVKRELSKLKLNMDSVLEEKNEADKKIEASSSKMQSYSSSAEVRKREIEDVNEEQVLIEFARTEAVKELLIIEARRKEEVNQFSFAMENTKKKMNDVLQEIDHAKELETKLAVTNSDANMLQNELKMAKEMDRRVQRNERLRNTEASFRKGKELDSPLELQSVTEELEAAKKELASNRQEAFQFMASMDIIRDELKHVMEETARLMKTEEKAEVNVQNLNSRLLRANAKLEAVSAAEENAKTMVSNLSLTLEQLRTEAEAARKEREIICEETTNIKAEVQKTESEIDLTGESLQAAMQELEAVKSSESMALENLKSLIENTVTARASASQHSSTMTISNFEYEYLTGRAAGAEEIADKKVAASQAWIEALKAGEKEILMKTEMAHRKIRELKVEEDQETYKTEKSLSAKRVVEGEVRNWRGKSGKNSEPENLQVKGALPTKPMKENDNPTPARRARFQKSASLGTRQMSRSGSLTVKGRTNVVPNLTKYFNGESNEKDR